TAEELIGVDLSHCKHLTLSACDTGRGSEITGQGVMGLRAALLASGARCVLLSLWKVPDGPTIKIMKEFYKNLWTSHMPPVEALNKAQLAVRTSQHKGDSDPVSWAAWVLVGQ